MKLNKKMAAVILAVVMVSECLPVKAVAQTVQDDFSAADCAGNVISIEEEEQVKDIENAEEQNINQKEEYQYSVVKYHAESTAKEAEHETLDDVTFSFKDGVLTFSGSGQIGKVYQDGEELEPEETRAWNCYKESTEKIVFEEGITTINQFAFMNFKNVKELSFPDSLKAIKQGAFQYCDSLEEVVLPDDMTYFGDGAFDDCHSLRKLTLGRLENVNEIDLVVPFLIGCPNLEYIEVLQPNYLFLSEDGVLFERMLTTGLLCYPAGKKDKKYEIPEGVQEIDPRAFSNNAYLEEVVIPDTVTTVDQDAFWYCSGLKHLSFPATVERFYSLKFVNKITGATSEGDTSVLRCNNLEYIENHSEAMLYVDERFDQQIDQYRYWLDKEGNIVSCISKGKITSKVFKKRLSTYDEITIDGVCYRCIESPEEEQAIEQYNAGGTVGLLDVIEAPDDFEYPSILEYRGWKYQVNPKGRLSVEFDNGVLTFKGSGIIRKKDQQKWKAYEESAIKLVFEEGISGIGNNAMNNFSKVKEIVLPDSLKRIEDYAFARCWDLEQITLPDNMTFLGEEIFDNCYHLQKITIGKQEENVNLTYTYRHNWIGLCHSLEKIVIAGEHSVFEVVDNVLFDKKSHILIVYPQGKKQTMYTVPSGTEEIGHRAFFNNEYIEQIVLPDTVKKIDMFAFYWCPSLKSISFPSSVKTFAFYDDKNNVIRSCDALEVIENKSEKVLHLPANEWNKENKTIRMWKLDQTDTLISTVSNGTATAAWFQEVPCKGEQIKQDGIIYRCLEGLEAVSSGSDQDVLQELMDRYNAGQTVGTLEVVSAPADKEVMDIVTYGGWKYNVKIPEFFIGDLDGNGEIDASDALIVLKVTAGLIKATDTQKQAGDVDGNGIVDASDALMILKYVAGLITEF